MATVGGEVYSTCMEILGQRPVWSMSDGEKVSSLDAAYAEIARLETFALHVIADLDDTGYAQDIGAGTTARFLTLRYRIDAAKARRDVHLATALTNYPTVAAALPDPRPTTPTDTADDDVGDNTAAGNSPGDDRSGGADVGVLLHPAQAGAIVSALEKVPATVLADDIRAAEEQLVELGRTHGPLQLRDAGKLIGDRLDTDGPEPAEQKAYDREALKLKKVDNGVAFTGYLANENAELFRTLIHTHAKPRKTVDGALDPRGRDKRQADALTTILATAINPTAGNPATPPAATPETHRGHGPKAQITVTIDFNDLKAATADKVGHLIYGDALSAATIRRLACDAQILPVVLGSESQPLDVGTTVRLATGPMRKALIARDKSCVCCGAPPIYCDAHHVVSWIDGGETKITNLVLICKRCHRDLHAGHWDIQITNGIVRVARPAWATPCPIPRGSYRPPIITPTPAMPAADAPTAGRPVRVWPRDTDPPWMTSEEAARLNPWGDTPDERPTRAHKHQEAAPEPGPPRRPAGGFDPWGEGSNGGPRGVSTAPAGKETVAPGVDVRGEAVNPVPAVDRRSKPGTDTHRTFDPWGDLAPETVDAPSSADEDPGTNYRVVDPSSGSTQPGDATATTAA